MQVTEKIWQPYYLKARNELTIGFILSVFFCSKIKSTERKILYIFYIGNLIPHEFLKEHREIIDKVFLVNLLCKLSGDKKYIKKEDIRRLTGLEDKTTFNKYFGERLLQLGISKNKRFTLLEFFKILRFWQGDDKWGRMQAFTKGELAKKFTSGNYDELELQMTNAIFTPNFYRHHDFIKPADAKKFLNDILDTESLQISYDEIFEIDDLVFFFLVYLHFANRDRTTVS
ncbi:hypothetical protein ACJD0Z_03350 [Flavobacteriaceae bacterium M23B6Z8]